MRITSTKMNNQTLYLDKFCKCRLQSLLQTKRSNLPLSRFSLNLSLFAKFKFFDYLVYFSCHVHILTSHPTTSCNSTINFCLRLKRFPSFLVSYVVGTKTFAARGVRWCNRGRGGMRVTNAYAGGTFAEYTECLARGNNRSTWHE